jgi:hypothetical protein
MSMKGERPLKSTSGSAERGLAGTARKASFSRGALRASLDGAAALLLQPKLADRNELVQLREVLTDFPASNHELDAVRGLIGGNVAVELGNNGMGPDRENTIEIAVSKGIIELDKGLSEKGDLSSHLSTKLLHSRKGGRGVPRTCRHACGATKC